jgi:hypothetical protein
MTVVKAKLEAHLRGMTAPFLFIGSGMSRRYVGAEDWEGLLRHFASLTPRPYEFYRASAAGDLPTVASKIAEVFHTIWWDSPDFEASRAAWSTEIKETESALKVEISRHLSSVSSRLPTTGILRDEIDILGQAVVDGIITTNYDSLLESIFPDFRVFVGQNELLFSNPQGIGEIYKIHGSCTAPDSLVLTAADYESFDQRNPYLAAKLMTIFVEHPVIFLGYSLGDRNVISILQSIASCLTQENIENLRDRLIFVQWDPNGEAKYEPHTIMVDGYVITVTRIVVPDFTEVFSVLSQLHRTFPAKLLRRLKEQVYELVLTNDPHERLFVADIESPDNDSFDVVFGVGAGEKVGAQGYVGLDRWSLIDDVIGSGTALESGIVVREVLPKILRGSANIPVYKYLSAMGALREDGEIDPAQDIPKRVIQMAIKSKGGISSGEWHKKNAAKFLVGISDLGELEESKGSEGVLNYAVYLPPDKVDVSDLRTFLTSHPEFRIGNWSPTQFAKLTCLLDWLEFGRPKSSEPV